MIPISTSTSYIPYIVLDTAVAVGDSSNGFFSGPKIDRAFEDAKNILRIACENIGGDAVISCDFELRDYSGGLNVIAFGTIVKYIESEATA
ncbi:MAG: hypothetical protein KKH72_10365 [Alphaproteobacteria bacterium]|nr:hypothetical protein [Alphaproteobacteria bacterium]